MVKNGLEDERRGSLPREKLGRRDRTNCSQSELIGASFAASVSRVRSCTYSGIFMALTISQLRLVLLPEVETRVRTP